MRIDVQTHYVPQAYVTALAARSDFPRYERAGDFWWAWASPSQKLPMRLPALDIGIKLAEMDEQEIDIALISINIPGPDLAKNPRDADELARIGNDGLAEAAARHPGRFRGVASLGFGDMDATCRELEPLCGRPRFRGPSGVRLHRRRTLHRRRGPRTPLGASCRARRAARAAPGAFALGAALRGPLAGSDNRLHVRRVPGGAQAHPGRRAGAPPGPQGAPAARWRLAPAVHRAGGQPEFALPRRAGAHPRATRANTSRASIRTRWSTPRRRSISPYKRWAQRA